MVSASAPPPQLQSDAAGSGEDASKKVRKPYTITKSRESWTEQEHDKFLEALQLFDRDWKKIEAFVGSKTVIQIRSHAQKYFLKVQKNGTSEHVPPPRPKRKAAHPYPQKASKNEPNYGLKTDSSSIHRNSGMNVAVSSWAHSSIPQAVASSMSMVKDLGAGTPGPNNFCSSSTGGPPRTWQPGETNDQINQVPSLRRQYLMILLLIILLCKIITRILSTSTISKNYVLITLMCTFSCEFVIFNLKTAGPYFRMNQTSNNLLMALNIRRNGVTQNSAIHFFILLFLQIFYYFQYSIVVLNELLDYRIHFGIIDISILFQIFDTVMPDFAEVYSFLGSVFDPSTSGHLQKLKEMNPIDVETALLLMKNLSINLTSPDFEDQRKLLSSYSTSDGLEIGSSRSSALAMSRPFM